MEELGSILEIALSSPETRILIFSEWEPMLLRVRKLCEQRGIAFAWHVDSQSVQERLLEIRRFKNEVSCRLFLSTDAGGSYTFSSVGIVINLDIPWSPSRLEHRIAHAWKRGQIHNVTVVNLVAEESIESRLMEMLARRRAVQEAAEEGEGSPVGRMGFFRQLMEVMPLKSHPIPPKRRKVSLDELRGSDPELGFAMRMADRLGDRLVICESIQPKERAPTLLLVVEGDLALAGAGLDRLRSEWFGSCVGMRQPDVRLLSPEGYAVLKHLLAERVFLLNAPGTRLLYRREGGFDEVKSSAEGGKALVQSLRRRAVAVYRKARRLIAGLSFDQAREPISDALILLARAYAVEKDLVEPLDVTESLETRFAPLWGDAYEVLIREVLAQDGSPALASRVLAPFFGG